MKETIEVINNAERATHIALRMLAEDIANSSNIDAVYSRCIAFSYIYGAYSKLGVHSAILENQEIQKNNRL